MKLSRLHTLLVGIAIIVAGAGIFLDAVGLMNFSIFSLWPLILLYYGLKEWGKGKRVTGGILTGLGVLFVLNIWFDIGIETVFALVLSGGLIFFGIRLIRSRNGKEPLYPWKQAFTETYQQPSSSGESGSTEQASYAESKGPGYAPPFSEMRMHVGHGEAHKNTRSTLIGDFHLTSGRYELSDMHVWHGFGNVVIDLSRALLLEDEVTLTINGWINDITIYVPVDLACSVTAEVMVGDLGVFGHHQGGMNRRVSMRSENFDTAAQKVSLKIGLFIGDIDVKYI